MTMNYFYNGKINSKTFLKISCNYKEKNQVSKEVSLYNEMVGFSSWRFEKSKLGIL